MSLPFESRLRSKKQIEGLLKKGEKIVTPVFVMIYAKSTEEGSSKFGFISSKKVGNAVERNKSKRILKNILYNFIDSVNPNFEVVFILRQKILNTPLEETESYLEKSLKKIGVLKNSN